jgi:hypothetical protein
MTNEKQWFHSQLRQDIAFFLNASVLALYIQRPNQISYYVYFPQQQSGWE